VSPCLTKFESTYCMTDAKPPVNRNRRTVTRCRARSFRMWPCGKPQVGRVILLLDFDDVKLESLSKTPPKLQGC
jgi:hypothetical protein